MAQGEKDDVGQRSARGRRGTRQTKTYLEKKKERGGGTPISRKGLRKGSLVKQEWGLNLRKITSDHLGEEIDH